MVVSRPIVTLLRFAMLVDWLDRLELASFLLLGETPALPGQLFAVVELCYHF